MVWVLLLCSAGCNIAASQAMDVMRSLLEICLGIMGIIRCCAVSGSLLGCVWVSRVGQSCAVISLFVCLWCGGRLVRLLICSVGAIVGGGAKLEYAVAIRLLLSALQGGFLCWFVVFDVREMGNAPRARADDWLTVAANS